ncbi:hypothetical protein Tcan_14792 [Toxocara canis]|uniref:Uncharacterized protein n=1 Tax=Toxocara canis TaxID=6265 RepID=A0A0B2W4S3_TOXCA|nr:hypothetical protein Tcan_14792 [Toxocara canis]
MIACELDDFGRSLYTTVEDTIRLDPILETACHLRDTINKASGVAQLCFRSAPRCSSGGDHATNMDDRYLDERPQFSEQQIVMERQLITIIDGVIAECGRLNVETLYEAVQEKCDYFRSIGELHDFIRKRSNVFKLSFNSVCNRSIEYRKMFGFIINSLMNMIPERRTLANIGKIMLQCEPVAQCEVGCTFEHVRNFVKRHPHFYRIRMVNEPIELLASGGTIASAWQYDALPQYKGGLRYDRSIELTGHGRVVNAVMKSNYVKIEIDEGLWKGQTVYGIGSNVSGCEENIAIRYPCGTAVAQCEVGCTFEHVRNFVKRTSTFYRIRMVNEPIELLASGGTIASAWQYDALPQYKGGLRYDRSIELTGHGRVVNAVMKSNYVKIEIDEGLWKGQTVYGIGSNVSGCEENIAIRYPCGTAVNVRAFRAYGAAHPWTASKIADSFIDEMEDIWTLSKPFKKSLRGSGINENLQAAPSPVLSISSQIIVERKFFEEVLDEELNRIAEADQYLSIMTSENFMKIIEDSRLLNFMHWRTHLYEVYGSMVSKRSDSYREQMLNFLRFVSASRISVVELCEKIKGKVDYFSSDFLAPLATVDELKQFVHMHGTLFDIAELHDDEYICVRGTFVSKRNVFIPKFYFSSALVDAEL